MILRNWSGWWRMTRWSKRIIEGLISDALEFMLLTEDRTVYVSYRIAGRVYWTTKQVKLHRGEKVITDGKMTLRTRCGNQVSESARQEVSPNEPAIAKMERPMLVDPGTAMIIPFPTTSSRRWRDHERSRSRRLVAGILH